MVVAMKHMVANFSKLEKFEGVDFRRWQKKMQFLLSSMSVVYVLSKPVPDDGDDATMEQIRKKSKWENDDYVCRGLIIKYRSWFKAYESLNDGSIIHMGNESTALVHGRGCVDLRFSYGKIVSLFKVLNVPNIWKNLVSSSVLNNCGYKQVIESDKFVFFKHAFMLTSNLNDSIIWLARLGHVHFKECKICIRFYVTEPNEFVSINSIIESKDAIFDENKFSSIPKPSQRSLINKTIDIGVSKIPKDAREEIVVQQSELRKSKRIRTPKSFGS
ncbi:hypothetical protein Tco_0688561 [Tanacetum coccineum]